MRFEADLLLEIHLRGRLEALDRFLLLLAMELLDCVAHAFRLYRRFRLGLDPKPGFPAWGIANISHASSQIFLRRAGYREPSGGCGIICGGRRAGKAGSSTRIDDYSSIFLLRCQSRPGTRQQLRMLPARRTG